MSGGGNYNPPSPTAQWAKRATESIRSRCTSKKLPFNLNAIFLHKLINFQGCKCFYCFEPFLLVESPRRLSNAQKPTVDRVDPRNDIGYIQTNVVVACGACNELKSDGQLQEFERLARGIRKHVKLVGEMRNEKENLKLKLPGSGSKKEE